MSDSKLRAAYRQALRAYEAARDGHGVRVRSFVAFLSAECALASRDGQEICRSQPHEF